MNNCKYLEEGQSSPKASIEDINWLAGHWQGEAFGGFIEEIWTHARGGAMMGSFRMIIKEKVSFYELMTVTEAKESLLLRIKHFDKDLKGWEDKNESVNFKLVELNPHKIYFEGLTMERLSNDQLNIYVIIDHEGKKEEAKFKYYKVAD